MNLREAVASLMPKPRTRHIGEGQKRAAICLYKHRVDQARRVAPALPVLAEKRKEIARRRFARWTLNKDMQADLPGTLKAPGHISAMLREART